MGRKACIGAALFTTWALTGCESPSAMKFAPLNPELERVSNGGARYLVLVNTSGQELHHCTFTAYLMDQHNPNPLLRLQPFARCAGSKTVWFPDEEARFRCSTSPTLQFPITQPLTQVEVVGHCDEGRFHLAWRINESENEVRAPGVQARFSAFPLAETKQDAPEPPHTAPGNEVRRPEAQARFAPFSLVTAMTNPPEPPQTRSNNEVRPPGVKVQFEPFPFAEATVDDSDEP